MVFNTGMTGYQEIATDPSYYGQMVTYTYPGGRQLRLCRPPATNPVKAHSRAIVVREIKNHGLERHLPPEAWVDWLTERGIVGVAGVDTRALTRGSASMGP